MFVGPKGDPGAAGVAGKDGLIGMDGKDGKDGKDGRDGLDGAPGAVGQAGSSGTSVLSVAFTGVQGGCTVGGVKFTDGAGKTTFACNGINGTDGQSGSGGSGNSTITNIITGPVVGYQYAQGAILVGACDSFITIKPQRAFTRMGFAFSGFAIGDSQTSLIESGTAQLLNGGIEPSCDGEKITIEFFTDSAYDGAPYSDNDHLVCTSKRELGFYSSDPIKGTKTLEGGVYAPGPSNSTQLASGDFTCKADSTIGTSPRPAFALAFLNTADYTNKIGFQIG